MGRELRRKQAKKEGKSLQKEEHIEKNQLKQLLIITAILVFIICTIYIISALFITKELDWFDNNEPQSNQTLVENTILGAEIFNQKEEEYYVYLYEYNNEDTEVSDLIKSRLSSSKVYRVDISSALNKKYASEESNKSAKTLDELKVKSPTVIKVVGDEITEYYERYDILNNLK